MSWNQWTMAPPMPAASSVSQPPPLPTNNVSAVSYSAPAAPPSVPAVPPATAAYNYAAMTPEQQYAIQQNWQQWQAYQQQYAQWHAQYGEQYQREMQAKLGTTAPQLPYAASMPSVQVPPPTVGTQSVPTQVSYSTSTAPQGITSTPEYTTGAPPTITSSSATPYMGVPPPPPDQETQKYNASNATQPPPPIQDNITTKSSQQNFKNSTYSQMQNSEKDNFNKNRSDFNYNQQSSNRSYGNNNLGDRRQDYNNQKDKYERFENQKQSLFNRNNEQQASFSRNNDQHSFNRGSENHSSFDRNNELPTSFNRRNEQQSSFNAQYSGNRNFIQGNDNQKGLGFNEKSKEEILFDEQFQKWEEEFENWKRANVNHPDKRAYREYELKFEECRRKLIERRELMRKRKLEQLQKEMAAKTQKLMELSEIVVSKEEESLKSDISQPPPIISKNEENKEEIESVQVKDTKNSLKMKLDNDDKSENNQDNDHFKEIENQDVLPDDKNCGKESPHGEFLSSSAPGSGIPGLDLVENNDANAIKDKGDKPVIVEVIDLERPHPKDGLKVLTAEVTNKTLDKQKISPWEADKLKSWETDKPKPWETDKPKPWETDKPKPWETDKPKPWETDNPKPWETEKKNQREAEKKNQQETDKPKQWESEKSKSWEAESPNSRANEKPIIWEADKQKMSEAEKVKPWENEKSSRWESETSSRWSNQKSDRKQDEKTTRNASEKYSRWEREKSFENEKSGHLENTQPSPWESDKPNPWETGGKITPWENQNKQVQQTDAPIWSNQTSTPQTKKIPSLFDIQIEKPPDFSPPRSSSNSDNLENSNVNIPHNDKQNESQQQLNAGGGPIADNITKVLQDPSVLALLSSALNSSPLDIKDNSTNSNPQIKSPIVDLNLFKNQAADLDDRGGLQNPVWENQDNRRQDMNLPRFGNDFRNSMNQRDRYDDRRSTWQNYDRNDNRGSNFYNNERNRSSGGGYDNRSKFEESENNFSRNNESSQRGFNPFKREVDNRNRDEIDDRRKYDQDDMNRDNRGDRNQSRERDRNRNRDRSNREDTSRNRNRDNRNDRSRSNNRSNPFDDRQVDDDQYKNEKSSSGAGSAGFNPFRRDNVSKNPSFGNNEQLGNDDYFKPAQVIDYQNKSLKTSAEEVFPLAKIVDYGHKRNNRDDANSGAGRNDKKESQSTSKSNDDFFPMKTIDYGHSSTSSSSKKNTSHNESVEPETPSSLGGGFGDFLASRTGSGNVEDFKSTVFDSNTEFFKKSETLAGKNSAVEKLRLSMVRTNANKDGNLNNESCIENTYSKREIKSLFDNYKKMPANNEHEKNFCHISDKNYIDDDAKYFTDAKTSSEHQNKNKAVMIDSSTSFSTYMSTKLIPSENLSENNSFASPPHSLLSNPMFGSSNSDDKPIFSFNNNTNNDSFENLVNTYTNIPCPIINNMMPLTQDQQKCTQFILPSIENKNTITIDEILLKPGRDSRPKKIVIILRGPPGSGKSYIAKLIKRLELQMNGTQPRILSIDDYFMNEVEKEERCPKTNRKIVKEELVYEYDKKMEEKYMEYLLKSYKKTLSEGLFPFVIVDCQNESLRTFTEFYNIAKAEGFTPYTIDLICDLAKCLENNIHKRDEKDIEQIIIEWKETPEHYIKLNIESLLKQHDIQEVVMEDAFSEKNSVSEKNFEKSGDIEIAIDDENSNADSFLSNIKSKWDVDQTEERLARLDGVSRKQLKHNTLEDYLQIDGWEPPQYNSSNKKRVRWADIEEKRTQDKMRAIGFVVGYTDWTRMMDPTAGSSALTKTKYIERVNKPL